MLETEILGFKMKNPTMLASGIMGTTGDSLKRVAEYGAGALVSKSAGIKRREGHRNPTVVEIDRELLNAVGLSNPGVDEMGQELQAAKSGRVPVIASIFGFTVEDYTSAAKAIEKYRPRALELNLSCPNVERAGDFFGSDPDISQEVVKEVKKATKLPVSAKLTANADDIVEIARACQKGGAEAVTAINTIRAMEIDIDTKRPILGNKTGGLSGTCIKPIGVRAVYEIAREVDIPIIGCGGITTGEDALEYLMAGASAVQIGTGTLVRGISIFKKVSIEIKEYMEENRYSSLKEIIGLAL